MFPLQQCLIQVILYNIYSITKHSENHHLILNYKIAPELFTLAITSVSVNVISIFLQGQVFIFHNKQGDRPYGYSANQDNKS